MGAIELTRLPLDWESDAPVWTPQWPLTKEKLAALTQLVNEQLQKKNHIEPTFSPWNSPVFVTGWGTRVYLWQIHFDIWQN